MTIDEKIKQAAEAIADAITIDGRPLVNTERSSFIFGFYQGEQYPKLEMLADMQKLAEALGRALKPDVEYESLIAKEIVKKALVEFNAKYKDIANGKNN